MVNCTSCSKETHESVKFPCPGCGNEVLRCDKCRNLSIDFECKCGHTGP